MSLTEAQKRYEEKCRTEFGLNVKTKMVGMTFWVYLPTKESIFDYEAQKEKGGDSGKKPSKYIVQYLDGGFKDSGLLYLEYDVVDRRKAKAEDYGYSSSYTDSYVKNENNLLTAVSDVFFNAEPVKGEVLPLFFVIVVTDIQKGIETRVTFYLDDFKRYLVGDLPYEEYMKRFIADTKGGQALIGDEVGSHIEYRDVTMKEFLEKQIINRINFKFQHSDFGPDADYDDAIIDIVADTTRFYSFDDYAGVQLNNIRNQKKLIYEKNLIAMHGEDKPAPGKPEAPPDKDPSSGKLIRIRFENGEAQFNAEETPSAP